MNFEIFIITFTVLKDLIYKNDYQIIYVFSLTGKQIFHNFKGFEEVIKFYIHLMNP